MSENTQATGATNGKTKRNYGPKESVPVSIPDILNMMAEGKTRKQIGDHYGLNQPQTKALFDHPKLKGKKTTKQAANAFQIVDEGGDDIPTYVAPKKSAKEGEAEGTDNAGNPSAATSTNGQGDNAQTAKTEPAPVSAVWE
jgi:hypothetical protein